MKRALVLFASVALALPCAAEATRLLIPVSLAEPVPGAHGSSWITELVARNDGEAAVHVRQIDPDCGGILCERAADVPPQETVRLFATGGTDRHAAIIEIDSPGELSIQLRVQDLSRQAETWGTQLPVVPESEFRSGTITLVNVPVTDGFRNTLRIYALDRTTDTPVRIRLYRVELHDIGIGVPVHRDELLGEKELRLRAPIESERERSPSYLELSDLAEIAPLGDASRVAIQIEPVQSEAALWAFVSITNNATQHVTLVTPE